MSYILVNEIVRRNFRHLYWDIFWFGVLSGSTITFIAVYAARLGASSFQIGLLSAGPAAVNLLFTLPSGRWLQRRSLYRSSFRSSVWQRLGYIMLIALPWLVLNEMQIWGIIWTTLIMSIPGTLLVIAFNALFAEVVPPEYRGEVVGRRNALLAISVTVSALVSGQILDRAGFPGNYQLVFLIGTIGALMSSYHLSRIRPDQPGLPDTLLPEDALPAQAPSGKQPEHFWTWIQREAHTLIRLDLLAGPFGLFLLAFFIFYTFQYLPFPLFTLMSVNGLHLSDSAISLGTAVFNVMVMLGSLQLDKISRRFGHRGVLLMSAVLFGHYPLLLGMAQDAVLFWVVSVTGGLVFAMLSGSLTNRLMERVPQVERPAYMTLHNMALSLGVLLGSLLGPALGDWFGLREALFISAGLRLFAAGLVWLWG